MKIGILGAGRVGGTLAKALASRGHEVIVGSPRGASRASSWDGPDVRWATLEEAATPPLVIHATPGGTALDTLRALRESLRGSVLVDVANATERLPSGLPGGLCYPNGSLAEEIQRALPDTQVVKTLNTMPATVMTAPGALANPPTAFMSGNDERAKGVVAELLQELGWSPEWILDLGAIETARATEALVLLVPHVVRLHGFAPFAVGVVR